MKISLMLASRLAFIGAIFFSASAEAAFKLPAFESSELPNGLKVFVQQQSEVPLVNVQIAFRGGSIQDGSLWGISSYTGDSLNLGTKTRSKNEIEETLDFYGAEYSTGTDKDSVGINLSLASGDLPKLLPLLAEIITEPAFPEKELAKLKEKTVSELRKGKDSPNRIGTALYQRLIFKGQPYGIPNSGTSESVQKIRRQDVVNHYQKYFVPGRAAISIVGSVDPQDAKALIEKHFGAWKAGKENVADVPASKAGEGELLLIDKADSHETTFRIGGPGVPRNNKDWVELQVINTILGGRFTSMLNEELRIKSGYTYGARSGFDGWQATGAFTIQTFTATKTTFETLDLALKTYERFWNDGFDQTVLDSAKAYVKGQYPPRFETLAALSSTILDLWLNDISLEEFNQFDAKVDGLSLSRARELVKQYFPKDKLSILLIGQGKAIAAGTKKYGTFRTIPIQKVDQAAPL